MFDPIDTLRKLSKTSYWQTTYSHCKEYNFDLFKNKREFSEIQVKFLNMLSFYSAINMDIALGDVDERVLENFTYEDAYVYYRSRRNKVEEQIKESNTETKSTSGSQWVFRSKE